MFTILAAFFQRLKPRTAAECERAYLNGAVDRLDLEFRERQVERGLFHA